MGEDQKYEFWRQTRYGCKEVSLSCFFCCHLWTFFVLVSITPLFKTPIALTIDVVCDPTTGYHWKWPAYTFNDGIGLST